MPLLAVQVLPVAAMPLASMPVAMHVVPVASMLSMPQVST